MLDKNLFDRFLKNQCSAEERRMVSEYLATHPEEAAALLPEEEFEQVEPASWDARRSDRSFNQISRRLSPRTHPMFRWSLVAASALAIFVGIKWLTTSKVGSKVLAKTVQTAPAEWITEDNTSSNTRTLLLPDGSSAELSPGSSISYRRSFTADDKRLIRLKGEGQFNVTGDARKPFTVISGELTTTVLGTWFSVTADPEASTIKVHLYSGKVRVGMSDGARWKTKDSVLYLKPGEELTYNKQNMLAVVRSPQHRRDLVITKSIQQTTTHAHPLTASSKPEWYMFGGQSLAEVFDQLSDYYGVQINYFPADVENHYFTARFSKSDSLEDILNDIAVLHGLTLSKKDGMYVFRKKDK